MERSSILIGVSYLKRGPFIGGGSLEGVWGVRQIKLIFITVFLIHPCIIALFP
jgi:hypothetical protein